MMFTNQVLSTNQNQKVEFNTIKIEEIYFQEGEKQKRQL